MRFDNHAIKTIITDEDVDVSELPDRKKIFLESESLQDDSLERTNDISSSADEEDLPSWLRSTLQI